MGIGPDAKHAWELPPPVVRAVAAMGLLTLVLIVASLVRPGDSGAAPVLIPGEPAEREERPATPAFIGSIEGATHRVDVYTTPDEARYTVVANDGTVVMEMVDSETLGASFPEFRPEALHARYDEPIEYDPAPRY